MATRRRNRFIYAQTAWMLGTVIALALLGSLSYELFFVVSLIGFLVVVELTAPFNVTPRWRARLKWLIAAGLAVFGYIVVRRILEILPPEVVEQLPGLTVALPVALPVTLPVTLTVALAVGPEVT